MSTQQITDNITGRAKGGVARAQALSPEKRTRIAKQAADARWGAPKAEHTGELHVGELTIACAVLPDGTRVLSQRGVGRALGRGYGGSDWKKQDAAGGKLPFFLKAKVLKQFITEDLLALAREPIPYRHQSQVVERERTAIPLSPGRSGEARHYLKTDARNIQATKDFQQKRLMPTLIKRDARTEKGAARMPWLGCGVESA